MSRNEKRRDAPAVNAGSMADIAFLLLIFFLVTTTILEDQGILVRLPQWDDDPVKAPLNEDNVLTVKINSLNQVYMEGEVVTLEQIRKQTKQFITNSGQLPNRPEKPSKAIVSIQHDRGTEYDTYLQVYNEIKGAYNELWDDSSLRTFNKPFAELKGAKQEAIKKEIPLVISEAEPTIFFEEQ